MFSVVRLFTFVLLIIGLALGGCSSGNYVRHLASDASLVVPLQSTKKDIMSYLGPPDNRQTGADGERWIYYQRHKSLLRKLPYIGDKMGYEDYDVLIITFQGDLVKSCTFRMFNEKELKDSKLKSINSVDKE